MNGTEWVAAGQGSTLGELYYEFSISEMTSEYGRARRAVRIAKETNGARTNLCLTGKRMLEEDWARLESAQFKVGE